MDCDSLIRGGKGTATQLSSLCSAGDGWSEGRGGKGEGRKEGRKEGLLMLPPPLGFIAIFQVRRAAAEGTAESVSQSVSPLFSLFM